MVAMIYAFLSSPVQPLLSYNEWRIAQDERKVGIRDALKDCRCCASKLYVKWFSRVKCIAENILPPNDLVSILPDLISEDGFQKCLIVVRLELAVRLEFFVEGLHR